MTAPAGSAGRGIVLFGHGSRDPEWRRPMDAVAARIEHLSPGTRVACAFLEMQHPDLDGAVDQLLAAGVASVSVLPMFLGQGRHAREDLPKRVSQVRQRHPALPVALQPSAGESAELVDLLARLALREQS